MKIEDYNEYYIQNSNHYLIPKDVFIELFNEMFNWREESKELNQKYLNAVADYETTMSELQELKKENKILRKNAENNDKVVDKVNWENMLLKKENKQLKDNWNKLRDYLHNVDVVIDYSENYDGTFINYDELVNIMQELEGSD